MKPIDKDALVAKIEKRFDEYSSSILRHYDACTEARASELGKILVILNTLEVKEVDSTDAFIEKACEWLNKESESYVKTGGVGACVTYEGLDVKELVEDFEKYMKGE